MINWGLAQGNNALSMFAMGAQLGERLRAREDERKTSSALSAFASNPGQNDQDFSALLKGLPGNASLQLTQARQQYQQQQAQGRQQAAQQRRADIPTITRLLEGSVDQVTYDRNVQAAQGLGIDTSQLPRQFDPAWRDEQVATMKLFGTPEGREAFSTAGKEAQDAGYQPGTPEFNAYVKQRLMAADRRTIPLQPGGSVAEYDPATGQARLVVAPNTGGAATGAPVGAGGPQVGAVVGGYRFKGGNPNDRANWEQAGGGSGNATGSFR